MHSMFHGKPIISIRSGMTLGVVSGPVVNPDTLKLEGFYVNSTNGPQSRILLKQDAREMSSQGIIIDNEDELVLPTDIIRLKDILQLHYDLIGKKVITKSKKRLGEVTEYVVESSDLSVQKIHVAPPFWKLGQQKTHVIDRTQIISVNDQFVKVKDATIKSTAPATVPTPA